MRVYVIGGEGQVARSLREAAARDETIVFGHGARPDVDLAKPASLQRAVADFRPDVLVNPAAYTAVDKAESEPGAAFALNRDGARLAAETAARHGVPIIHLSTDYVFDGAKSEPYVETDEVSPRSVYGRSKLEGEIAVSNANPQHVILRTAWVYAPFGGNFVRTMLRLSAERERLTVVDDQIGCPTYAPDIAGAVLAVARKATQPGWDARLAGVTHLAGPDALTWCGFARRIIAGSAARGGRSLRVDAITTADYPTPAARPANSRLSTARLNDLFGIHLPTLDASLGNCLDRLLRPQEEVRS